MSSLWDYKVCSVLDYVYVHEDMIEGLTFYHCCSICCHVMLNVVFYIGGACTIPSSILSLTLIKLLFIWVATGLCLPTLNNVLSSVFFCLVKSWSVITVHPFIIVSLWPESLSKVTVMNGERLYGHPFSSIFIQDAGGTQPRIGWIPFIITWHWCWMWWNVQEQFSHDPFSGVAYKEL